jgi:hypothetical protein
LYDLESDPFETRNVSGDVKYREVEHKLREEIDTWWSQQAGRYPDTLDQSFKN